MLKQVACTQIRGLLSIEASVVHHSVRDHTCRYRDIGYGGISTDFTVRVFGIHLEHVYPQNLVPIFAVSMVDRDNYL